jgi:S1-C subfamily serine protease
MYNARTFYIVFAICLAICYGGIVFAQEHANVPDHVPCTDGVVRGRGVGFRGSPPSYLALLKAGARHSGTEYHGTGTWLTDRLILTCEHNVRDVPRRQTLKVHSMDGTEYTRCRVVQRSRVFDLALVFVDDRVITYHRTLGVQNDPYPLGALATQGWDPEHWGMSLYQGAANGRRFGSGGYRRVFFGHDAECVQGMSGGPVIDDSYQLIGVSVSGGSRSGSLAVDLSRVQSFLTAYDGPTGRLQLDR